MSSSEGEFIKVSGTYLRISEIDAVQRDLGTKYVSILMKSGRVLKVTISGDRDYNDIMDAALKPRTIVVDRRRY